MNCNVAVVHYLCVCLVQKRCLKVNMRVKIAVDDSVGEFAKQKKC
jgi:hypothetical protein